MFVVTFEGGHIVQWVDRSIDACAVESCAAQFFEEVFVLPFLTADYRGHEQVGGDRIEIQDPIDHLIPGLASDPRIAFWTKPGSAAGE